MPFSDDVRTARKAARLTQEKAAEALTTAGLDVALRTLAGWERGEFEPEPVKQAAVLDALRRIAEARPIGGKLGRTSDSAERIGAAPGLPPIEEVVASLRQSFGDGIPVDVPLSGGEGVFEPAPRYLPELHMEKDGDQTRVTVIGRVVHDARHAPDAPDLFAHRMPTAAFADVAAGSPLYSQPCADFAGAGYYEVDLDGAPLVVNLTRVPGGGFRLRMDDGGPAEYVDPDGAGGWIDRASGRACRFRILALILTSHRVHAAPIARVRSQGDGI